MQKMPKKAPSLRDFDPTIMEIVRAMQPSLMAAEIIGVQPMDCSLADSVF